MPKIIKRTVYQFGELSPEAKQAVVQKLWEWDNDWWGFSYEDFVTVAAAFGFEIDTRTRGKHTERDICFKSNYGFCAGFNATWRLLDAVQCSKKIKEHLNDEELDKLAVALEAEMTKFAIVGLEPVIRNGGVYARIRGDEDGIKKDVNLDWDTQDPDELTQEQNDAAGSLAAVVESTAIALARWLAKQLEAESDYRQSEECAQETCEANEYWFDENGRMV